MATAIASKKLPKGITKTPSGTFRVSVMVEGKRTGKTFTTLEEAKQGLIIARASVTPASETEAGSATNVTPSTLQQESTTGGWTLQ